MVFFKRFLLPNVTYVISNWYCFYSFWRRRMKCHCCHKDIIGTIKYIDTQPTCRKCYYEGLGKIMEKHPLGFGNFDDKTTL